MTKLILLILTLFFLFPLKISAQINNYPISKDELIDVIYNTDSIPSHLRDVNISQAREDLLTPKEYEDWRLWQVASKNPEHLSCVENSFKEFYDTHGIRYHECTDSNLVIASQKLLKCLEKVNAISEKQMEVWMRIYEETTDQRNAYNHKVKSLRKNLEDKLDVRDRLQIDSFRNVYYKFLEDYHEEHVGSIDEVMDFYCDYKDAPNIEDVTSFIFNDKTKFKYEYKRIQQSYVSMILSDSTSIDLSSYLTKKYMDDLVINYNSIVNDYGEYNRHLESLKNLYIHNEYKAPGYFIGGPKRELSVFLGMAFLLIDPKPDY